MRLKTTLSAALLALGWQCATPPAQAQDMLHLYAAGSLTQAMTALLAAAGIPADHMAPPVFGPSGGHCR